MKAGQWSNEQTVVVLQQAATGAKTISTLCKEKGSSEATFYAWRQKFGGMNTREVQRLKEVEKENARLKKLLADRDSEIDCLKEVKEMNAKNWYVLPRVTPPSSIWWSTNLARSVKRAGSWGWRVRVRVT